MHYSFSNYESNDSKKSNHSFQKVNIKNSYREKDKMRLKY